MTYPRYPLPLNPISKAASTLYNIVPLGGPLFSCLATPPSFFSITPSKLSKENAHFLFAEQCSLLLCLVVPKYNMPRCDPPIGS